jgi:hypothetical protein
MALTLSPLMAKTNANTLNATITFFMVSLFLVTGQK